MGGVIDLAPNPSSANGSRTRPRACWLPVVALVGAVAIGIPAAAQTELPDIGNPVDQVLSPQEEAAIGRDMMAQARARLPLNEDPEIADYIDRVGGRLTASLQQGPVGGFTFFVVRDRRINAFAAPRPLPVPSTRRSSRG